MKEQKYVLTRIATLISIFTIVWNSTRYTFLSSIREDSYLVVAELDRIFYLELIFLILFLLFILTEIYVFTKRKEIKMRNVSIFFQYCYKYIGYFFSLT